MNQSNMASFIQQVFFFKKKKLKKKHSSYINNVLVHIYYQKE